MQSFRVIEVLEVVWVAFALGVHLKALDLRAVFAEWEVRVDFRLVINDHNDFWLAFVTLAPSGGYQVLDPRQSILKTRWWWWMQVLDAIR
ncbi:MAG: hypothetical protein PHD99_04895 [Candidatus Moranbacteria bacterium]|nr:hypothetical protein [Candidatus Moranbacteria bacterium]